MRLRKIVSSNAAIALLLGLVTAIAVGPASASVTPGWEPDPNQIGSITFYDSTGAVLTGGSLSGNGYDLTHIADYAVVSSAGRTGATKATLFFSVPDHTKVPTAWATAQASASTVWPVTAPAAPAVIKSQTTPVVTLGTSDANLQSVLAGATLDHTAGYDGLIEVRIKDSGPGLTATTQYWRADIAFDTVANSWSFVYPPSATTTSTTQPTPSVASPISAGTSITLSSTATAADASHPAGAVQFLDNGVSFGSPVSVNSAGTAVSASLSPTVGTHSYTAVFTPTDNVNFTASPASSALSYTVNGVATSTTTPTPSSASPIDSGTSITLSSTATAADTTHPAGNVEFFDGVTSLGFTAVNGSGTATLASFAPAAGTHSFTAVFTPGSAATYAASSPSSALSFKVRSATTTTTPVATPSGPYSVGDSITLSSTASATSGSTAHPSGTVQFLDGVATVGSPVAVNSSGLATTPSFTLTAGAHSYTAVFTPTDTTLFTVSPASAALSPTGAIGTTASTPVATPPSGITSGTAITLQSTGTTTSGGTAHPAGSIQFLDNGSPFGSAVAIDTGTGSATTTPFVPTAGTHSYTAVYTPTVLASYNASPASSALSYKVKSDTTVTVPTANPATPVTVGATITLSATASATAGSVSHPAGSIQFLDGVTPVGSAVAVDASGVATTPAFAPTAGAHSYTAVYTATDGTLFNVSSASAALSYSVNKSTSVTAPTPNTASPVAAGTSITLQANETASDTSHPAGSIQFYDNGVALGSAVVVDAFGAASSAAFTPAPGAHSFTAVFTPTDAGFAASLASPATSFTVTAIATSVTTPSASVPSPVTLGTAITLTATAAAGAAHPAGSIQFYDNGAAIGAAVAVDGAGNASLPAFSPSAGSHSYAAIFTPSDSTTYTTSPASGALAFSVNASVPVNTVPPTVSGAAVGSASVCRTGTWTGATSYTYAWYLDASTVPFATTVSSPLLPASYLGHKVRCAAAGVNGAVAAGAVFSAQVKVGLGAAPKAKKLPLIAGLTKSGKAYVAKVGKALAATTGVWTASPVRPTSSTYHFMWKVGKVILSTKATYKPSKAYKGKVLVVVVTAVRGGFKNGVASSVAVKIA